MTDLLLEQHVSARTPPLFFSKPAVDSLIKQIKQQPVKAGWRFSEKKFPPVKITRTPETFEDIFYREKSSAKIELYMPLPSSPPREQPWLRRERKHLFSRKVKGKKFFIDKNGYVISSSAQGKSKRNFSFISCLSLLFILIVISFSFIAINWDSLSSQFVSAEPLILSPGEDGEYRDAMVRYAGFSAPARGEIQVTVPGSPPALSAEPLQAAVSPLPSTLQEAPVPLDLAEIFSTKDYRVRQGDTISGIAAANSLSMDAIIALNGISNARRLQEGQIIKIPNMDGIPYTVKDNDTLTKISQAHGVPITAILDANDMDNDRILAGAQIFIPGAHLPTEELKLALGELFIFPIAGRLTSSFGWRNDPISGIRRYHAAIDLAASLGTPVKAAMDGKIASVGFNATYGKFIIITHSGGYQTMYAHLNSTAVKEGAQVRQGSKIGEVGTTGYSTGPHLHFAVYKNNRAINPYDVLSP
jgi:murein DD-endopeptidase MepM/ murein hydrolase activator NlpD